MRVFCYPISATAFEALSRYCTDVGLPAPATWRHTDLHRTLRELVRQPDAGPAPNASTQARIAALPASAVVFHRVPPALVRRFALACKQRGTWPLLAIVTRQSLDMPLAVLFDHLLDDRAHEAARRRQQAPEPPRP